MNNTKILPLGTIVRNLHTGDEGIIIAIDDDIAAIEMFDDGEVYPIPMQSLVRTEAFFGTVDFDKELADKHRKKAPVKKVAPLIGVSNMPSVPQSTDNIAFLPQGSPADSGLHLAHDLDERRDAFIIYLVNDTNHSFVPMVSVQLHHLVYFEFKHSIEPYQFFAIGEIPRLSLNESPQIHIAIPSLGIDIRHDIRPKAFFKSLKTLAICPKPMYVWTVAQKLLAKAAEKPAAAVLKKIATENRPALPKKKSGYIQLNDLQAFAAFKTEIDLHENVLLAHKKVPEADILRQQILAFEQYLSRAIMLAIPRVYIIHGNGRGRLRDEIHRLLKQNKYVIRYNNDFHPKYGGGATEVVICE
jgi:hypothetical protein